ncbi:hypothetical protein GCM10011344_00600 [Dokdonia pacifica]|uniref:Uncharacterized protein n=1 Tax=Dokdonia pacifica TaxID=1627892 RepID=A0A239D1F7_9FLAO|nr:hypothetical protein [Dokdonia pacifica]GGG04090.1 hypothetical protein GCM10011344_00600 [Dokdonia pacifica]SNS25858.1 hypothetical protein SAMN06265376_10980 [Dokdonia pacifica]
MKYHSIFLLTFLIFGCKAQGQNRIFKEEEKKAKEFMESKIVEIYNDQFKTEFIGTWHEFGKIYGFKFYVVENNDNPIAVEYNLENQSPFEFNKEAFEKEYESIKVKIKASEELEKNIRTYFSNARVLSDRIENRDGTYRWVNTIYTAIPLDKAKEKTFSQLDSLCMSLLKNIKEQEVFYNFYFPKKINKAKYSDNRFSFFEYDNFRKKHMYHYRVDFTKNGEQFEKTNQKLYDNLNEKQSGKLKDSIEKWGNKNGFEDWEISLLIESSIDRDLDYKKFMLKSSNGEKKFGFINKESNEIID